MTGSFGERSSTSSPEAGPGKILRANGVDLCVETFGDPADAPILLIHGAAASLLAWEDGFCERLTAREMAAWPGSTSRTSASDRSSGTSQR